MERPSPRTPRIAPRQRLALAVFVALTVAAVGTAVASPENGGNPNVTLDISPNDGDNLNDTEAINVVGAGFGASSTSGTILECSFQSNPGVDLCAPIGRFTANSSGNFTTTVAVTRTFASQEPPNTPVNCAVTACTVQAVSDNGQFFSKHHLSFGSSSSSSSSSTTSSSTPPPGSGGPVCDRLRALRAQSNTQIAATEANLQSLSSSDRAAVVAHLEAARQGGNSHYDAALAAAHCA